MIPSRHRRLLYALAATLVIAGAGATVAVAQRIQAVYGSNSCTEAGRAGVLQLSTGGYVAVGQTNVTPTGCGQPHIYVVRTQANGAPIWANIYTIGSTDSALDVIECSDGMLAVCGVTTSANGCDPARDAFVMRISPTGGPILAVATVGSRYTDEIAWNLVEAQTGNGITTHAGDLIAVGSTTANAGAGRDGYIFRTDVNLNLIWSRHYGGAMSNDDYLYGVDECRMTTGVGYGDIAVTGGTNTWGAGSYDIWVMRVSGADGTFGGTPRGAATYGDLYNEEGRAIIELRSAATAGNLVIAGISDSRPNPPNTNQEVAMLQTGPSPCTFVADQYAGDNGADPDGGMDVKEDPFWTISTGTVIVTGYTSFGIGTIPAPNVFLQRFAAGSMLPTGNAMGYGGNGTDWGWSINICRRGGVAGAETPGYVIAGFTQSNNLMPAGDPQDLYLIKTDQGASSGCYDFWFLFSTDSAHFIRHCTDTTNDTSGSSCRPDSSLGFDPTWNLVCYNLPQARDGGGNGNDGASGVESPAILTFTAGRVGLYPNPVKRGAPLDLRFDLSSMAQADVTVTDLVGRVIYQRSRHVDAGSELEVIPTGGWPAGTYLVRLVIGDASSTTRFVLIE